MRLIIWYQGIWWARILTMAPFSLTQLILSVNYVCRYSCCSVVGMTQDSHCLTGCEDCSIPWIVSVRCQTQEFSEPNWLAVACQLRHSQQWWVNYYNSRIILIVKLKLSKWSKSYFRVNIINVYIGQMVCHTNYLTLQINVLHISIVNVPIMKLTCQ